MWHKGYTHYHTSFHYPPERRVTPKELADDLKRLDAGFVFCAGDHGKLGGEDYWGMDIREYPEYRETCLSVDESAGVMLIPSPEIHMMFPPFNERHEHHTCVTILDYLPNLNQPKTRETALSYTSDAAAFIEEAHRHNISLPLNHAYGSAVAVPLFSGPQPLDTPSLHRMDYLDLVTLNGLEWFVHDFDLYLQFLSRPVSAGMACCGGVDNCETPSNLLSRETRPYGSTFLHVPGDLTRKSVLQAWNERRSYMVCGDLRLEKMDPVPSRNNLSVSGNPSIRLIAGSPSGKKLTGIKIYRNGQAVYRETGRNKDGCELNWQDGEPLPGGNSYIVHLQTEGGHLVTSPITYA